MAPKLIDIVQLWLIVLLATQASAFPLSPKEETIALYLPIDIKHVALQVPDESLNVDPLSTSIDDSVNSPVVNKDHIMKEIYKATVEPIQAHEDLAVVPLETVAQQIQKEPGNSHRLSKRQAQRLYRPVIRFSRFSSSRRRVGGFSRSPAMVGYLNDRDYFPTVA